jgi:uncharacterized membrane protein YkoI
MLFLILGMVFISSVGCNDSSGTPVSSTTNLSQSNSNSNGDIITPEQAEAAALAVVSGTILETELENEGGRRVYGVEIRTSNGVVEVQVDATTGQVIGTEPEDD